MIFPGKYQNYYYSESNNTGSYYSITLYWEFIAILFNSIATPETQDESQPVFTAIFIIILPKKQLRQEGQAM